MHASVDGDELSSRDARDWSHDSRRFDLRLIRQLGPEGASVLQSHRGALLLWGLRNLTSDAARNLSEYRGCLDLRGLTELSETAAAALGTTRGYLNLSGMQSLPSTTASGLRNHKGYLDLSGLEHLSVAAARELSHHTGFLDLSGIRVLSTSVLGALGNDRIGLNLNGLTTIDPEGAENVAQAGRILCLEGLKRLDSTMARALASGWSQNSKEDRWLFLADFATDTSLPDEVAETILAHDGSWAFGLDDEFGSVEQTSKDRQISLTVAQAVDAARLGDSDYLKFIRHLTRAEAIVLSYSNGEICLYGLDELSVEAAEILAVRNDLEIDFPKSVSSQAILCLWPYLNTNPWIPGGWRSGVAFDVMSFI